jgi:hypothetical protein
MSLPHIVNSTRVTVHAAVPSDTAGPSALAPPQANAIPFVIEFQEQTNWCWAAVSKSVSHFFDLHSQWTQCRVVNEELGKDTCCGAEAAGPCNQPWYLDRALTRTQNFVNRLSGSVQFGTIRAEIDARRPLCARIGWNNGSGGHFVTFQGYSTRVVGGIATPWVEVEDPNSGHWSLSYDEFRTSYPGNGSWTHTYFTT